MSARLGVALWEHGPDGKVSDAGPDGGRRRRNGFLDFFADQVLAEG